MEGKQHTQSIIAKLMGLEELPHKLPLPINKKRKVLSENYLQKTASIGLREKSSILVGRSTRINTQKHQEVVKVFETQMPTCMSTRTTVGDTMRSLPKMETGLPMGSLGEFGIDHTKEIEFLFEPYKKTRHTKIIVLGPSSGRSGNTKNHLFSLRSGVEMESVNSEYKEFIRTENGPVDDEEADGEGAVNSVEPLGNSSRVPREILQKTSHSIWDGSKYEHSRISPLDSKLASATPKNRIGNEASKYVWHLRKKEIVDGEDSNSSNLKQKAGLECRDLSSVLDQSSGSIGPYISSAYGQPEEVNKMIDDENEIMSEKDSVYRGSKHASGVPHCPNISPGNTMANANAGNIRISSIITDELQSEPNLSHSYIEDDNTSTISVGQESWNEAHEIGALSTKHTMVDPKFPQNLRETNQTSPSSVLEPPFKEEKLCASELNYRHADLCSVAMQLELLDTNSEETYSEGSEMAVSSDDVYESVSLDLCQENKKILIDFNTEESRDYSYLADVLDEVNLHDMNLMVDYSIWSSSECPVNSSVFDMLEKKYGKQKSWPKSDRKLLFDSINSGLSEIVLSFMDIYTMEKSLKRRYHFRLWRNEVEEESWKLLVSPKEEVCEDLSEKALGNGTRW